MQILRIFFSMQTYRRVVLRKAYGVALCAAAFFSIVMPQAAQAHLETAPMQPVTLQTGIATIELLHSPRDPQIKLSRDPYHNLKAHLNNYFQTTRIFATAPSSPTASAALDPDAVWNWPAERFEPMASARLQPSASGQLSGQPSTQPLPAEQAAKPIRLAEGQSQISRLRIKIPPGNDHLHLSFELARLDKVEIAWRSNGQAWHQESAGDRIAQHEWPVVGRYPTFDIDVHGGEIDLVVKITHAGALRIPITLKDHNAILAERTVSVMLTSLAIGVNFVLAMVAVGAAISFRRVAFFAVAVMLGLMGLAVFGSSGLMGMYVFEHSASFNDQIKLLLSPLWAASLPSVAILAFAGLWRNRFLAGAALAFFLAWMLFVVLHINPAQRDTLGAAIPLLFISSLAAVVLICTLAWLHLGTRLPWALTSSLLLAAASLLMPTLSRQGLIAANLSILLSGYVCIAAGLLMLRALVKQYQYGRMASLRADETHGRDALTGLLSHETMSHAVRRLSAQLYQEGTHAVFMQIDLGDADQLRQRYGDEGFERGLLQVAAALAISHGGWENISRIGPAALGMTAILPPEPQTANARAQKILTRLIFLAGNGTPLAGHARIALAWMPSAGVLLSQLMKQCDNVLRELAVSKRITWVGGSLAHESLRPVSGESLAELIKSQMHERLQDSANYRLSQGRASAPSSSPASNAAAQKISLLQGSRAQAQSIMSQPGLKPGLQDDSPPQPQAKSQAQTQASMPAASSAASPALLAQSAVPGVANIDAFIKRVEQRLRSDAHYRLHPSTQ